jgi:hypothetical protein
MWGATLHSGAWLLGSHLLPVAPAGSTAPHRTAPHSTAPHRTAPEHPSTAAPHRTRAPHRTAPEHRSTAAPQHPSTAAPQHPSTRAPQHHSTAQHLASDRSKQTCANKRNTESANPLQDVENQILATLHTS